MKRMTAIRFSAAAIVTLTAALSATPVAADGIEFRYRAYELHSAQGRENVLKRVTRIARSHCGYYVRAPIPRSKILQCADTVVADIVDKIGDRRLIALHNKALVDVAQR